MINKHSNAESSIRAADLSCLSISFWAHENIVYRVVYVNPQKWVESATVGGELTR